MTTNADTPNTEVPTIRDLTLLLERKGKIAELTKRINEGRREIKEIDARAFRFAQERASEALTKAIGDEVILTKRESATVNVDGVATLVANITTDHPVYKDQERKEGGFIESFEADNPSMKLKLTQGMQLQISVDLNELIPRG